MKKPLLIMLSVLVLASSFSTVFAEDEKELKEREGPFDTTSNELKENYQSVNAALLSTAIISADEYPGPFAGPGYYMGMNGPLVTIAWLKRNDKDKLETAAKRYIPIGSVISADLPMMGKEVANRYAVYYKGPFGDTEFFMIVDSKKESGEDSIYSKFISRWKLYLLSQEP